MRPRVRRDFGSFRAEGEIGLEISLTNVFSWPRSLVKKPGGSLDLLRSIRFGIERMQGQAKLQASGVFFGRDLDAIGAPHLDVHPGSEIRFGDEVTLISCSFATGLGVNHAVVMRTLAPGAAIRVGNRVGISGGSICAAKLIEIGDDTLIGANVTIADTDFHSLHSMFRNVHEHPSVGIAEVRIGRGVFIGTNAIVLKGVNIGDRAVIGAGSVVTRDIPADCVAAGNPCRVVRVLNPFELEEPASAFAAS
jgi:acetyltransferase-like isoleucine patch superfamily enzyme